MDRYIVTLKDEIKGLSELEAGYVIGRMIARIDNLRDEYIHVCKEREEANKRHEAEIKKLKWGLHGKSVGRGLFRFRKRSAPIRRNHRR